MTRRVRMTASIASAYLSVAVNAGLDISRYCFCHAVDAINALQRMGVPDGGGPSRRYRLCLSAYIRVMLPLRGQSERKDARGQMDVE